ncbi:hypothetical protein DH86_00000213, partial [Scytalidium sp. 3C]
KGGPAGIPWNELASNIINRHSTDDAVLDNRELSKLREFLSDENVAAREAAEARGDCTHTTQNGYPTVPEPEPSPGSLIDFIIRRHRTDKRVMLDNELDQLRTWFKSGEWEPKPTGDLE